VPGLAAARAPSASPLPCAEGSYEAYASVRLLRDRAVAARPDFELGAGNADEVARICRALDGMPLAIELAAVWLRTLTPAQLAERLDDRFALLTGGSRIALPRHRTLRAVVDWSWDLLTADEQVLARRLAVFPAGATLAMAEQVCADELLPAEQVLPALSGLVDKSIIAAGQSADAVPGPRYRMLETVRAYGLERLAEAGEQDRVRDAFASRYLDLAETADPRLRAPGQGRWLRELAAEQDNLHAALRWAITRRDADTALRFVRALGWYWVLRGQPGEPEALARAADARHVRPHARPHRPGRVRLPAVPGCLPRAGGVLGSGLRADPAGRTGSAQGGLRNRDHGPAGRRIVRPRAGCLGDLSYIDGIGPR
jgi:predicted ATPase